MHHPPAPYRKQRPRTRTRTRTRTSRAAYSHNDLRSRLGRHHADPDGAFYGWADVWLELDFRRWNIERFLPGVRVPTLVIQGESDEYSTLAQVDAICQKVSGTFERLILPACGHAPHRDRPAEVLAAMARFITQLKTF